MRKPDIKITGVEVVDLRVPTSDSLLGSDPFHRKPDYSAVLIRVTTDSQIEGCSVIFKQMLASGALSHCQIDATRLGGVNDVLLVILMAKKFNVPVCPHGGGIGLCNMIPHYALWDQIAVSGQRENRFVEYLDFLQDDVFEIPVATRQGHYVAPTVPGWGLEMKTSFIEQHQFPDGPLWANRTGPKGPAFLA